ncbi:WD40-repeat-containing domain protein [Phlyctochytrium arcticum]|nr:WD40-repeat-containing domain protein [Phlyctochytrium arcticum]
MPAAGGRSGATTGIGAASGSGSSNGRSVMGDFPAPLSPLVARRIREGFNSPRRKATIGRLGTPSRSSASDRLHNNIRTPTRSSSSTQQPGQSTNGGAIPNLPLSPSVANTRSPRTYAGGLSGTFGDGKAGMCQSPRSSIISARNTDSFIKQRLGVAGVSPGGASKRGKVKDRMYDRFVPSQEAIDRASSQFNLRDATDRSKLKTLDPDALAYQEQVARACGVALDKRILAFNAEPPAANARTDIRTSWSRPLRKPNSNLAARRVKSEPEKILDAPGMSDDYYLNLMDWSSNNVLAIALDNTVYLWNGNTGTTRPLCSSTREDTYIASIQWAPDGSHLAVGSSEGDIEVWSIDSMKKMRTMRGRASRVGVLSWDTNVLSSGARDGSIWNHDVRAANHRTATLLGHDSDVCGLKWRPDGMFLASGGNDNKVVLWDAKMSTPKFTKGEHKAAVKAVAWCPWQLNTLATGGGSHDRTVHLWNVATTGKIASIDTGSQVTSIIWSTEYKEFFTSHGYPNNHLSIWRYPSLTKIGDLEGHDARVLHSAQSPDGQTVATGASDENLKFWSVWESRKKGAKADTGTRTGSMAAGLGRLAAKGSVGVERDVEDELSNAYRRLAIR